MNHQLAADVPDDATTVLVLSPATASAADICVGLSAREGDALVVGYTGTNASALRERLGGTVEELGVGTDIEPGDLTGLGIEIAERLAPGTEVCFDSVTALLQYADRERSVRFLHSLGERCVTASASLHLHLDPETTDEKTVAAISMLVDAVVDNEAGAVRLRPELQKD